MAEILVNYSYDKLAEKVLAYIDNEYCKNEILSRIIFHFRRKLARIMLDRPVHFGEFTELSEVVDGAGYYTNEDMELFTTMPAMLGNIAAQRYNQYLERSLDTVARDFHTKNKFRWNHSEDSDKGMPI